jgi:hypothetical protein
MGSQGPSFGASSLTPEDKKVIKAKPSGDGYVSISCSWEDKSRKTPIAEWALENFAAGWKAELVMEAGW